MSTSSQPADDGPEVDSETTSPDAPAGPPEPPVDTTGGAFDPLAAATALGIDENAELDPSQSLADRFRTVLVGKARDLGDTSIFHHLTLAAFLAWVGLGADGLSSSCYGPAEAFHALAHSAHQDQRYLAVFLALAIAATVFIISACYSHIIEEFPSGGGGYLVASKLLGPRVGVVSGCALLVDYALTITTSIAAAGDALFGLMGLDHKAFGLEPQQLKLIAEGTMILILIVLNLRGVKESVMVLMPIFLIFLITHVILIVGGVAMNFGEIHTVTAGVADEVQRNLDDPKVGLWGMLFVLLHAYSLGAGTYTGIEAVSNSMPVMREPRVATGKRTMLYMSCSLALTAGGLMLCYLLLHIKPSLGDIEPTMNNYLSVKFVEELGWPDWLGKSFVWVTVFSEGALLIAAAQAGFMDGPRVLANMARDSWMPHWFANLSERLATHNGVMLMGFAGLLALIVTGGNVSALLVMYSINVFLTFSLSMIGMCRHWWEVRHENPLWRRRMALFVFGAAMCLSILAVTVVEKFEQGGYRTLGVTGFLVFVAFLIHKYYDRVREKLSRLNELLNIAAPPGGATISPLKTNEPTAAILVGGYSGLGVHTFLNAMRFGPGKFSNVVFLSVGIIDSGNFKGSDAVEDLRKHTEESLAKYVDHARRLGMPAASYMAIGTDPVDELEHLCVEVKKRLPRSIFFAGQLVFQKDTWYQRLLHNETAYSLQRRLQWDGVPMVILPTRVK